VEGVCGLPPLRSSAAEQAMKERSIFFSFLFFLAGRIDELRMKSQLTRHSLQKRMQLRGACRQKQFIFN
jgi:hypothetical protein